MRAGVAVQDITSTIRRVPSVRSRISLWEGFFSSAYHKSFHATTSLWQRIFPRSSIVVVCFIAPSAAAPISTRSTILPIAHRKLHRNTEPPAWWRWAVLRPHHHHGFSPSCWGQHLHPWRQCGLVATGSSGRNRRRWRRRPRWHLHQRRIDHAARPLSRDDTDTHKTAMRPPLLLLPALLLLAVAAVATVTEPARS